MCFGWIVSLRTGHVVISTEDQINIKTDFFKKKKFSHENAPF